MLHLATALEPPQRLKFLTPKNGSDITPNPCSRPCETVSSRIAPYATGKSIKAVELAVSRKGCWRNIAFDSYRRMAVDQSPVALGTVFTSSKRV